MDVCAFIMYNKLPGKKRQLSSWLKLFSKFRVFLILEREGQRQGTCFSGIAIAVRDGLLLVGPSRRYLPVRVLVVADLRKCQLPERALNSGKHTEPSGFLMIYLYTIGVLAGRFVVRIHSGGLLGDMVICPNVSMNSSRKDKEPTAALGFMPPIGSGVPITITFCSKLFRERNLSSEIVTYLAGGRECDDAEMHDHFLCLATLEDTCGAAGLIRAEGVLDVLGPRRRSCIASLACHVVDDLIWN